MTAVNTAVDAAMISNAAPRCRELAARPNHPGSISLLITGDEEARSIDGTARVQTVGPEDNPLYHQLITAFEQRTGCPVIINTSFNVRGEPIVCTPDDAYRCFRATEMDVLVLEDLVLCKDEQTTP